jgi:hypothetical protein
MRVLESGKGKETETMETESPSFTKLKENVQPGVK